MCKLHFKPFKCCSWVPHLALLHDPVECDEDGEVGGADLVRVHEVVVRLRVSNTLKPGLVPGELRALPVLGNLQHVWVLIFNGLKNQ